MFLPFVSLVCISVLNGHPLRLPLCKWRVSRIKHCKTASVWPAIHPHCGLKECTKNTENLALVLISIWPFKRGDFHPWLLQRVQSPDKRLSEFSALTKQFSQKTLLLRWNRFFFVCLLWMLLPCLFSFTKGQIRAEMAWTSSQAQQRGSTDSGIPLRLLRNSPRGRGLHLETSHSQWSTQMAGSGQRCWLVGLSWVLAVAPQQALALLANGIPGILTCHSWDLSVQAHHSLPNSRSKEDCIWGWLWL